MRPDKKMQSQRDWVDRPAGKFTDINVVVIPLPALGDITIYLRLGWLFNRAGAKVTFYSQALYSAREYFPWMTVLPESEDTLEALAEKCDLLIAYRRQQDRPPEFAVPANIAFVAAKKMSGDSGLEGQSVEVRGRVFTGASRAFCLDPRADRTMVDWVDSYAKEVFGIELDTSVGLWAPHPKLADAGLVLIFPTTPQQKKNYWLLGFRFLAQALQRRGWKVEFVCTPSEEDTLAAKLLGYPVKSFPDIKALMDHVSGATAVISNDSGGGHLGSMMGLATFTITRRSENFAWRPGFNQLNTVVYPWFRFKWFGKKYIWRPFVPVWRIAAQMGERKRG